MLDFDYETKDTFYHAHASACAWCCYGGAVYPR